MALLAGDAAAAHIALTAGVGSAAGEDGVSGTVEIFGPHLTKETTIVAAVGWQTDGALVAVMTTSGRRNSSADVDAVQLFFDSGVLETGTITFYGKRNS